MSIKSIKILNVMAFQRQWRLNNGDCNTFDAKPGDIISDTFELRFCDGINILMKQYKSPSRAGETNKCWRR